MTDREVQRGIGDSEGEQGDVSTGLFPFEGDRDVLTESSDAEGLPTGGESEADEAHDTDGSSMSVFSFASKTDFEGETANYIRLGYVNCRHLYKIQVGSGAMAKSVPVACGRLSCKLRGHQSRDKKQDPGYYVRQPKGNVIHGRCDYRKLNDSEYQDMLNRERKDLHQAGEMLRGGRPDRDSEGSESADESSARGDSRGGVAFDLTTTTIHGDKGPQKKAPPRGLKLADLDDNTVAQKVVASPRARALDNGCPLLASAVGILPGNPKIGSDDYWFSLEDKKGRGLTTENMKLAESLLNQGYILTNVLGSDFSDYEETPVQTAKSRKKSSRDRAVPCKRASHREEAQTGKRHDQQIRKKTTKKKPPQEERMVTYGLAKKGTRICVQDPHQLEKLMKQGWKSKCIFRHETEAEAWLFEEEKRARKSQEKRPSKKKSSRDSDISSDESDDAEDSSSETSKDDPNSSDESSETSEDDSLVSDRYDSPSEPSSSEDSSSSSESSDSDSSQSTRHKKHRKGRNRKKRKTPKSNKRTKKKKKSKSKRPKKSKKTASRSKPYGPDESTKDATKVFGVSLDNEGEIGKLMSPEGLRRRSDQTSLAESILDVMNLPGAYIQSKEGEETGFQEFVEGASALLTQATGKTVKTTMQWRNARCAALSKLKTPREIRKMITSIRNVKEVAFKQQRKRIKTFLHRRRYTDDEIDEYLYAGMWIRVSLETFDLNLRLLSEIEATAHKHNRWDGGLPQAMLAYHQDKLWSIRAFSDDYRDFLLHTYVYLRDAAESRFYHTSMLEDLWQQASALTQVSETPTPKPADATPKKTPKPGCSHCNSKNLHTKLELGYGVANCPLREKVTRANARKLAKELMELAKDDPQLDIATKLDELIPQYQ